MVLTYLVSVVCWNNVVDAVFFLALPSLFFCFSGGIAIGGAQSPDKCLVVATLVMSTIFALSALALLVFLTLLVFTLSGPSWWAQAQAMLPILLLLSMVIVPTISARLACKALRSQKRPSEGVVQTNQTHYHPNQVCYQPN